MQESRPLILGRDAGATRLSDRIVAIVLWQPPSEGAEGGGRNGCMDNGNRVP